jgi:hypothetical protein
MCLHLAELYPDQKTSSFERSYQIIGIDTYIEYFPEYIRVLICEVQVHYWRSRVELHALLFQFSHVLFKCMFKIVLILEKDVTDIVLYNI